VRDAHVDLDADPPLGALPRPCRNLRAPARRASRALRAACRTKPPAAWRLPCRRVNSGNGALPRNSLTHTARKGTQHKEFSGDERCAANSLLYLGFLLVELDSEAYKRGAQGLLVGRVVVESSLDAQHSRHDSQDLLVSRMLARTSRLPPRIAHHAHLFSNYLQPGLYPNKLTHVYAHVLLTQSS